jgi:hydrogenase maturation protease
MTTLMLGLGSHHGDDQVGWRVAAQLAALRTPTCEVRRAVSPADLLISLGQATYERLIVCDGCRGAGQPGECFRWQWRSEGWNARVARTTHDLGLEEALAMAAQLGRLPPEVVVWSVELETAQPGCQQVSAAVATALPRAVESIRRELLGEPIDA